MRRFVNLVVAAAFVTGLAACATQPAPQSTPDYTPPRAKLDAKTTLETGRQYR